MNKPSYCLHNGDIDRSYPKLLHLKGNKPLFSNSVEGIEGASPKSHSFKTKRKPLNPVDPKYPEPKIDIYPPEELKFIRDTMNIKDIQGTSPKFFHQVQLRDTNKIDDITGTKPAKTRFTNKNYSSLDYSDVYKGSFSSKRVTNPLEPVYNLSFKGEKMVVGEIECNKPVTHSPFTNKEHFNLKTSDIKGCKSDTVNAIYRFKGLNLNLKTEDIVGAGAGSKKRGMVSKRITNPLSPDYKVPGCSEPHLRTMNNPYDCYKLKSSGKEEVKSTDTKKIESREPEIKANSKKEDLKPASLAASEETPAAKFNPVSPLQVEENKSTPNTKPSPYYGIIKDEYIIPSFEKHTLAANKGKKKSKVTRK